MDNTCDASAGGKVDCASSKLIPLRFPTTRDKVLPHGYMHIDEGLDLLGSRRLPEKWGMHPVWQEHPFRHDPHSNKFFRYRLKSHDDGTYGVGLRRVRSEHPREVLIEADLQYKQIRDELRQALEMGEIDSFALVKNHQSERIPAHSTLWAREHRLIFYVGFAHDERPPRRYRIMLGRASFDAWLNGPAQAPDPGGHLSVAAAARLVTELKKFALDRDLLFTRTWLHELVRAVLKEEGRASLGLRRFDEMVWSQLTRVRQPNGAPAKTHKIALLDAAGDIRDLVRIAIRASTP